MIRLRAIRAFFIFLWKFLAVLPLRPLAAIGEVFQKNSETPYGNKKKVEVASDAPSEKEQIGRCLKSIKEMDFT